MTVTINSVTSLHVGCLQTINEIVKYQDSKGKIDTPKKILKVNHAGEYGAINIYRSQLFISKILGRNDIIPLLEDFLNDEKRHLDIFWKEIQARKGIKCKSFWLCGLGGYVMGTISALMGRKGIMACTWAVESVVINHLHEQLNYLSDKDDVAAYDTVKSILEDEQNHRDTGFNEGGADNFLYTPLRFMISCFTEGVIRFGMR